jgi:PLP dependent protein
MTIAQNLAAIQAKINAAEIAYQRTPGSVQLLAASKAQSIENIEAAYAAGQRLFGENYLQEALSKIEALAHSNIEWHFIGPIQSNKTRKIAAHFAWVHSVADLKIAERLNEQRPSHLSPLNICIEVNVDNEDTKHGVLPADVFPLAIACVQLPRLKLRGLMAIPAQTENVAAQRTAFARLQTLWQEMRAHGFDIDTLSMGMSQDFEAAIAEGSTMIRIGTAIFGARPNR